MFDVILVEPKTAGNVGAVARVMANFELKNLILINPLCDHKSKEALDRSVHAKDILKKAKIADLSVFKKYDYVIGTTGRMGSTDYNIKRTPMVSKDFAKKISPKNKVAIVFGREDKGLLNEEIALCNYTLTIPSSQEYPSLNLSHAAAIVFYEIFSSYENDNITSHILPMTKIEFDIVKGVFNEILNNIDFSTPEKKQTQKLVWEKIFSKSQLSKREAIALIGGLKKIREKIKK